MRWAAAAETGYPVRASASRPGCSAAGAGTSATAYVPAPVGLNYFGFGISNDRGGVLLDASLPLEDSQAHINVASISFGQTLGVAGRTAQVLGSTAVRDGEPGGSGLGMARCGTRSGLGDAVFRWLARDPVISHALGIFTATFLYAVAELAEVDRSSSGRVAFISLWMVAGLLLASTAMFIALVRRIGTLRVDRMLVFAGDKGREVIAANYSSLQMPDTAAAPGDVIRELRQIQTLIHYGKPCSVQAIDVPALVKLARAFGGLIQVAVAVGGSVVEMAPLFRVFGTSAPMDERKLRHGIKLGFERTFEQDPKYAIRLLVDIAIKALSPAINDPTTAVQALDQIEDLLLRLGRCQLESGAFLRQRWQTQAIGSVPQVGRPAWTCLR